MRHERKYISSNPLTCESKWIFLYICLNFLYIILYLYCKTNNNMIHLVDTNLFTHQDQVTFNGEIHHSNYNHNYYTSQKGVIILEECNDDNSFYYWWVDEVNGETDYIGSVMSTFGIFDEEYDGYPGRNKDGIIELDTDFC